MMIYLILYVHKQEISLLEGFPFFAKINVYFSEAKNVPHFQYTISPAVRLFFVTADLQDALRPSMRGRRGSPSPCRNAPCQADVAGEVVGENSGWKIKLLIFMGGTCGSVHVQTLNNNLRELGVLESKRNTIRRGLVHELLNAQDTVLCSYFAQRSGARGEERGRESTVEEASLSRAGLL